MNAKQLFEPFDSEPFFRPLKRWFCGKCRNLHLSTESAEQCCKNKICSCGVEITEQYYTSCKTCRAIQDNKREQEKFEKAAKVESWGGPVFLDGFGYNEGYFNDVSDFYDQVSDEEIIENDIKYVWCCDELPVCQLDVDAIIESACENNAYEGFDTDMLHGYKELKEAIDKFNEANKGVCYYSENRSMALLVKPQDPQAANDELDIAP